MCAEGKADEGDCVLCDAGTYSTTIGATMKSDCLDCDAGKYSTTIGADTAGTCVDCPAGSYCAASVSSAGGQSFSRVVRRIAIFFVRAVKALRRECEGTQRANVVCERTHLRPMYHLTPVVVVCDVCDAVFDVILSTRVLSSAERRSSPVPFALRRGRTPVQACLYLSPPAA